MFDAVFVQDKLTVSGEIQCESQTDICGRSWSKKTAWFSYQPEKRSFSHLVSDSDYLLILELG